jgi:hypothetical protein
MLSKFGRVFGTALLIAVVLAAGSISVNAQKSADDWSAITTLAPGTLVELELHDQTKSKGRLVLATGDHLDLSIDSHTQLFSRRDIRAVRAAQPDSRDSNTNGALIGASVGAAYGLAVLAIVSRSGERGEPTGRTRAAPVASAGIGALAGYLCDRWRRRPAFKELYRFDGVRASRSER